MNKEVQDTEYYIRRYQRAIQVVKGGDYSYEGVEWWTFFTKESQRVQIMYYARKVIELKKKLYGLTGFCSPRQSRWPI